MLRVVIILLAMSQIAASRVPSFGPQSFGEDAEAVSLFALLANPAKYDGRRVRTEGFYNLQFEASGIFVDKEAFDADLFSNAIWVDLPPELRKYAWMGRFRRGYASIEGVFEADKRGHMGAYSGTLTKVTRISPVMTRADWAAYMDDTFRRWFSWDVRLWVLLSGVVVVPGLIWFGMTRSRAE